MAAADKTRIGAQLRKERKERGWDVPQMAHELAKVLTGPRVDHASLVSYVWRWEAGKYTVSERYRLGYAAALDKDESELFGIEEDPVPPAVGSLQVGDARTEWEDDMYRRAALQLLTALSAGAALPLDALETLRSGLNGALGATIDYTIDEWEQVAYEHAYSIRVMPPADLIGMLAADIADVRYALERRPDLDQTGMQRVSAQLAALMAMALNETGDILSAQRWWRTARHAAGRSGDRDLQVYVRGRHASVAYSPESLAGPGAAALQQALDLASKGRPNAGLTEALAVRSRVLAAMGERTRALQALRDLDEIYARLPAEVTGERTAIWGWPQERHDGERKMVRLALGDPTVYGELLSRTIATSNTRVRAFDGMVKGMCLIRAGEVAEGIGRAADAFTEVPAEHRTTAVVTSARRVIDALPDGKARALPAAKELRALTAGPLR